MRLFKRIIFMIGIIPLVAVMLSAQFPSEDRISIQSGLGFEYLGRSLDSAENGEENPSLHAMLFSIKAAFEVTDRVTLEAFAGYTLTSIDEMVFRELPFSLEMDSGRIGGLAFGGNLDVFIAEINDFEISGRGRIVFSIGMDKEWTLPGLAVEGTAAGSPNWLQIAAGPVFTYTGFDYFFPYLFVGYEHFSGSFTMEENVESLSGSEDHDLSSSGKLRIAAGTLYELTERFDIKGEISLIPYSGGVDWGLSMGIQYNF